MSEIGNSISVINGCFPYIGYGIIDRYNPCRWCGGWASWR
jgi:hypothetical protein